MPNEKLINDNIQVDDNKLIFSSRNDFNMLYVELENLHDENLNEFINSNFENFTSLKQKKLSLSKSKPKSQRDLEILNLDVKDPNFASILNEEGVFQIGEIVYKITNEHTYVFKNKNAYEKFEVPRTKSTAGMMDFELPCPDREIKQLTEEIWEVDNCGGGGGYNPSPPNPTNPDDLDPYDDLDKHYPSSKTVQYNSGGTKGRLRGESWNKNYFVFSSIGTLSVHERYTWFKWWDRKAEQITLDSFIRYNYGKKNQSLNNLNTVLTLNYGDFGYNIIQNLLNEADYMPPNTTLIRTVTDIVKNLSYDVKIYKHSWGDKYDLTIYPEGLKDEHTKSESNAKKIKKVYDWSTAVISYPPGIKQGAVDYKIDILRSAHTLKHDGYHLGFITEKR